MSDQTPNEAPKVAAGQFRPGNKAAAGNHNTKRAACMRKAAEAVTDEQMAELFKAAFTFAMQGDRGWAEFLCDRKYGKPAQAVEVTGSEGGDLVVRFKREGTGG